jgi:hypothetical protein
MNKILAALVLLVFTTFMACNYFSSSPDDVVKSFIKHCQSASVAETYKLLAVSNNDFQFRDFQGYASQLEASTNRTDPDDERWHTRSLLPKYFRTFFTRHCISEVLASSESGTFATVTARITYPASEGPAFAHSFYFPSGNKRLEFRGTGPLGFYDRNDPCLRSGLVWKLHTVGGVQEILLRVSTIITKTCQLQFNLVKVSGDWQIKSIESPYVAQTWNSSESIDYGKLEDVQFYSLTDIAREMSDDQLQLLAFESRIRLYPEENVGLGPIDFHQVSPEGNKLLIRDKQFVEEKVLYCDVTTSTGFDVFGKVSPLCGPDSIARGASFTSTGQGILFASGLRSETSPKMQVFSLDLSSNNKKQLTDEPFGVGYGMVQKLSPDGRILFHFVLEQDAAAVRDMLDVMKPVIKNLESGSTNDVKGVKYVTDCFFLPESRSLLLTESFLLRAGHRFSILYQYWWDVDSLHVMAVDSSKRDGLLMPTMSPNGRYFAYYDVSRSRLECVDLKTSAHHSVYDSTNRWTYVPTCFSPDNSALLYLAWERRQNDPASRVCIYDIAKDKSESVCNWNGVNNSSIYDAVFATDRYHVLYWKDVGIREGKQQYTWLCDLGHRIPRDSIILELNGRQYSSEGLKF